VIAMDEQADGRRPTPSNAASTHAMTQSPEMFRQESDDRRRHEGEASAAQQALIDALKTAGFKAAPSMHSLLGASVGIDCTVQTARELAAWIRARASAEKRQAE
jgi:hypothetical protein